jgi:ATP-binding cassette subfamily C (CFTR/MRP) protein 1
MKNLINFANDAFNAHHTQTKGPSLASGLGLALALTALQVSSSLSQHHYMYRSMMVGAQSRAALTSLAYRKSLVLSNKVFTS